MTHDSRCGKVSRESRIRVSKSFKYVQSEESYCMQVFKTLRNINSTFVRDYFTPKVMSHELRITDPVKVYPRN